MNTWGIILQPNVYRIAIGMRLTSQIISELGQNHTLLRVWNVVDDENCRGVFLVRVLDQSDLLTLLNSIHGIGLPISSIRFVEHG